MQGIGQAPGALRAILESAYHRVQMNSELHSLVLVVLYLKKFFKLHKKLKPFFFFFPRLMWDS
jgi:hypothetical protein